MLTFAISSLRIKITQSVSAFRTPSRLKPPSVTFLLKLLMDNLILLLLNEAHVVHYEPFRLGQITLQTPIQGQRNTSRLISSDRSSDCPAVQGLHRHASISTVTQLIMATTAQGMHYISRQGTGSIFLTVFIQFSKARMEWWLLKSFLCREFLLGKKQKPNQRYHSIINDVSLETPSWWCSKPVRLLDIFFTV